MQPDVSGAWDLQVTFFNMQKGTKIEKKNKKCLLDLNFHEKANHTNFIVLNVNIQMLNQVCDASKK